MSESPVRMAQDELPLQVQHAMGLIPYLGLSPRLQASHRRFPNDPTLPWHPREGVNIKLDVLRAAGAFSPRMAAMCRDNGWESLNYLGRSLRLEAA